MGEKVDISILDRAVSVSENAIKNLNAQLSRCETSKGYTDAFHKFESSINIKNDGKGPKGVGVIDVSDIPSQPENISMRLDNDAEVEKIVNYVINGTSYKSGYDKENKSTYLAFSDNKEKGFVDEERPFKDVMSELVTTEFLKHDSTMKSFLYIFIRLMAKSIKTYAEKMNISSDKIIFLYKGGNVLRYVLRQFVYEETGAAGDMIDDKFGEYFKKSDADFQINIDPGLDTIKNGLYDKVYSDIQMLAYHVLYRVRNVYLLTDLYTLDFEKLKPKFSSIILQQYLDKIKSLPIVNDKSRNSPYYGAKFLKLIHNDVEVGSPLPDLPYKEYDEDNKDKDTDPETTIKKSDICKRDGSKRADIAIVNSTGKSGESELHIYKIPYFHKRSNSAKLSSLEDTQITNKYFDHNDRNEMYISWNNSLEFAVNSGEQIIKFALVRSKINFKAIFETPDGKHIDCLNMGGEFIDISIPHRKGYESEHFFYNKHDQIYKQIDFKPHDHTTQFKLLYKGLNIPFHSYSLQYFIFDLNKMLFSEHPFVWEDPKYGKRLYRLFIFIYIHTLYETGMKVDTNELEKINDINKSMVLFLTKLKTTDLTILLDYLKNTTVPKNEIYNKLYKGIPVEIGTNDINPEKFYLEFCKQILGNIYNLVFIKDRGTDKDITDFIELINTMLNVLEGMKSVIAIKMQSLSGNKLDKKRLFGVNLMQGGELSTNNNMEEQFTSAYTKEYIKCKNKYLNLKQKKLV